MQSLKSVHAFPSAEIEYSLCLSAARQTHPVLTILVAEIFVQKCQQISRVIPPVLDDHPVDLNFVFRREVPIGLALLVFDFGKFVAARLH